MELISKVAEGATGKKGETANIQTMKDIDGPIKKGTVFEEFKLTKPKPKQLPEVEKIEVGFKAKPVPQNNKDLKVIEEEKKKRR